MLIRSNKNRVDESPETVLSTLFSKLIYETNISRERLKKLVEDYISARMPNKNLKEFSSIKSGTLKELLKPKMTFKVLAKGMMIVNIPKFDIRITAYHTNGQVTVHESTVVLRDEEEDEELDESDI